MNGYQHKNTWKTSDDRHEKKRKTNNQKVNASALLNVWTSFSGFCNLTTG